MVLFLQNPSFSQHTLDFCSHITKHFSFQEVLEGAIKRMAWHHCIPDLLEEEVAALEDSFKNGMMDHFKTFSKEERKLKVNLSELSDRVYKKVMSNFNC